jgi:hypothetical protein
MDPAPVSQIPLGWITSAGVALSGAIGWLGKEVMRRQKRTEEKLEVCEEKHEKTQTDLMEVKEELGVLRGRQEGVTQLAKQVLEVVEQNAGPS